ncbi:MAG: endonuclease [Bacteroidetes bacterium]|nr:endonuclease [Bacteroidota bacterium]
MKTMFIIILLTLSWRFNRPDSGHIHQKILFSENRANLDSIKIKSQSVRVAFWNIENLYDPYDDTTKQDDEFTAAGAKHWNWTKFSAKLNHVAKTLIAIGSWSPPAIVGLCEVENRYVLNKLIYETPLKSYGYKFIHHESPDLRGVDVAMLYRTAMFKVIDSQSVSIRFPFDTLAQTREILLVNGILFNNDTISIFINHWPSRRGGYLGSQPRRNYVATVLKKLIDSIQTKKKAANILVMGDFNDEPENESLSKVLMAQREPAPSYDSSLYNLMGIKNKIRKEGTLKYRDQWSTFDQFIVSGALMCGHSGMAAEVANVLIFKSSFLMEEDNTYFGEKLNRTYSGPKYHGGFSDHLPVRVDIIQTPRPR